MAVAVVFTNDKVQLLSLRRQLVFASLKAFPRNKNSQAVLHWG